MVAGKQGIVSMRLNSGSMDQIPKTGDFFSPNATSKKRKKDVFPKTQSLEDLLDMEDDAEEKEDDEDEIQESQEETLIQENPLANDETQDELYQESDANDAWISSDFVRQGSMDFLCLPSQVIVESMHTSHLESTQDWIEPSKDLEKVMAETTVSTASRPNAKKPDIRAMLMDLF